MACGRYKRLLHISRRKPLQFEVGHHLNGCIVLFNDGTDFTTAGATQRGGNHTLAECKGSDERFAPRRRSQNPEVIICAGASFADDWRSMDPESYELLQSICILEQMPAGKRLISWPPGVDVPVSSP